MRGREKDKKEKEKDSGLSFGKENKKVLSQNPRSYSILRVLWNHFGRSTVDGFQDGRGWLDVECGANTLFARPSFKAKCRDKKVERGNSLFTAAEYIVRLLIGKANGVFKSINKRGGRNA